MTKLLGNLKRGLAFVVSAPAGTGKTTLVEMLLKEFPCVSMSLSCTTREIRPGEIQGVHYNFLSKEEFERKIANNDFLEFVQLYGNYYGTDLKTIEALQNQGKHVILVIDTQGALQLKEKFPATFIFLKPPSLQVLRERLTQRRTETKEVIEERLEWARKEIELVKYYDYCIVNEELSVAYEALRSIVIAEEHRVRQV
jgi:guanylate kinase